MTKMFDMRDNAIKAVKNYLIELLVYDEFCQAKQVGVALKLLLNTAVMEMPIEDRIEKLSEQIK